MKRCAALLAALFMLLGCVSASAFEDRESLRDAWRERGAFSGESPYESLPSAAVPYAAGALSEQALDGALGTLNFMRALAGLAPVERSAILDARCQRGAVLLAANDRLEHAPRKPAGMDDEFYASASLATNSSNIARFNWMRSSILEEGIIYFARDDGDANLSVLGHRRWLLDPSMRSTGFGLAGSASGMSYVVMYAHDEGEAVPGWSSVAWPSAGLFPVEFMHAHLAWSLTLEEAAWDLTASRPRVLLEEPALGLRFEFDCAAGTGDGECFLETGRYGAGPALIFRPALQETGFTDYQQNQCWNVRVTGLVDAAGEDRSIAYTVRMVSLYPQPVANIEVSPLEASLAPGETLRMTAAVIPSYADDLSLRWSSSDETVARVDDSGLVTALSAGTCEIRCEGADLAWDACALTVTEGAP